MFEAAAADVTDTKRPTVMSTMISAVANVLSAWLRMRSVVRHHPSAHTLMAPILSPSPTRSSSCAEPRAVAERTMSTAAMSTIATNAVRMRWQYLVMWWSRYAASNS